MWNLVTLTFSQGHSIYWKFGKYQLLTIFWQYLRHYSWQSYDFWPKGSLWKDLKKLCDIGWPWPKGQGHNFYLKVKKYPLLTILTISCSLFFGCRVMKRGQEVVCGETFKIIWHGVTWLKGQGHRFPRKSGKFHLW